MNKKTKIWLIAAAFLVALGVVLFAAGMAAQNWDYGALETGKNRTETYEIQGTFHKISIASTISDIVFELSEDGTCRLVCSGPAYIGFNAAAQENTLTVSETDEREWYEHIGIFIGTPKMTLYLPEAEYDALVIHEDTGDVSIPRDFRFKNMEIDASTGNIANYASVSDTIKITASTGDIRVEGVSTGSLELSVSTGRVDVRDTMCGNLISNGSTGDLTLDNVIVAEKLTVERSTGDVGFDRCDAGEISVVTDTGDVRGSLCSEKVFLTRTDTGRVQIPQSVTGGVCRIETDTGDITISISE